MFSLKRFIRIAAVGFALAVGAFVTPSQAIVLAVGNQTTALTVGNYIYTVTNCGATGIACTQIQMLASGNGGISFTNVTNGQPIYTGVSQDFNFTMTIAAITGSIGQVTGAMVGTGILSSGVSRNILNTSGGAVLGSMSLQLSTPYVTTPLSPATATSVTLSSWDFASASFGGGGTLNSLTISAPEPASLAVLGVSLLGLAGVARRRRR